MRITCEQCPVRIMCQYKEFMDLVYECQIVRYRLYERGSIDVNTRKPDFNTKIQELIYTLKPKTWYVEVESYSGWPNIKATKHSRIMNK